MYGCESWTVKKAERRRIDAFELWCWRRLLRVPWTARRSNQSILKEDQSWVFIGRTDAKAETPILRPPHVKSWLIRKDPDARRDWGQEEKGMTEDEMAGWHHWLNGRESEWIPGVGDGQVGLACCDSWGHRVGHDWATELNWTELNWQITVIYSLLNHHNEPSYQWDPMWARSLNRLVPKYWFWMSAHKAAAWKVHGSYKGELWTNFRKSAKGARIPWKFL